jgi:hypothetical protein
MRSERGRISHQASSSNPIVTPLIDAMHARGFRPETCAMDKGYDNTRVYAECEERGCEPVIPLRGARANQTALPLALGGGLFVRIPQCACAPARGAFRRSACS